ncbi:MAG TPA: hypothetical protein PKE26_04470 [Kiritimatiellia bacterium]|nr:hypothetical protein [Kiritimatiellia bacterium]HMO98344.1 hypothetical protein [Kiritimatiellia bacterium]HMP95460.1 hypothetical protein [Kiritimatiellia bacterium]
MNSWRHRLGASSRCDLLRALYYQHRAAGLRPLARLAGIHPHAAERMLDDLVAEGVVFRWKPSIRPVYGKNPNHSDWRLLKAVFDAADSVVDERQQARLNHRARTILPFIEEAGSMVRRARRSIRVA